MKVLAVLAAVIVFGLAQADPARAHAERSASSPKEGATLGAVPDELNVTFTEPPTGDATVAVLDGCGRDVVTDVQVQNFEITAPLSAGQPGTWRVDTNVISAVDGHNTRDRWAFEVRGEPDCSAPESAGPGAAGDGEDEEGGGVPVAVIVLGGATVLLVVLGLALRGRGG
ncbi:MAG TPA: copper resistance CopC family protein [Actinomycetota bacterium]|nr:copper resistance CopC family protein [Actinomycetota bacterium]